MYMFYLQVCIMHWVLMGHCDRALSFAKKAMHVVEHRKGNFCLFKQQPYF